MAVVEADGETFEESDAEGIDLQSQGRRDFRSLRHNELAKVSELLKRRCDCSKGNCLTQLRGKEAEIEALRSDFQALPFNRKAQIS